MRDRERKKEREKKDSCDSNCTGTGISTGTVDDDEDTVKNIIGRSSWWCVNCPRRRVAPGTHASPTAAGDKTMDEEVATD